jgi:hypothetical protein
MMSYTVSYDYYLEAYAYNLSYDEWAIGKSFLILFTRTDLWYDLFPREQFSLAIGLTLKYLGRSTDAAVSKEILQRAIPILRKVKTSTLKAHINYAITIFKVKSFIDILKSLTN